MIDELEDIKQFPLMLVVTPDIWKKILGQMNANTDKTTLQGLNDLLTVAGGPGSQVVYSKYLGATIDFDKGEYAVTAGTKNAALMAWSSNHYEVLTSGLMQRSDENQVDGLRINLDEYYVPDS